MKRILFVLVATLVLTLLGFIYVRQTSIKPKIDKIYSLADVAKHNSVDDCWLVIKGTVYDVTTYIPKHPGGQEILRGCGRDATELFATEGKPNGRPHPAKAEELLPSLEIGKLASY